MSRSILSSFRAAGRAGVLLACALSAHAAQAAYAGLWFQCQPRWAAEKNYLLVDVKRGDAAWDARWGAADRASGRAEKDKQGNLMLRGCHAVAGAPARNCDPARPPLFATLPKAIADGAAAPAEAALRRGAWIRTQQAGVEQLAAQCGALRPKAAN